MWTKCNRLSVGRSVGIKSLEQCEATLRRTLDLTLRRLHLVDSLSRIRLVVPGQSLIDEAVGLSVAG